MAYADRHNGSRQLPSIVGVVVVHALIGYAFVSGLAMNVIRTVTPVFTIKSIPDTPPPPLNPETQLPPRASQPPEHVTSAPAPFDTLQSQTVIVTPPYVPAIDRDIVPTISPPPEFRAASKAVGPQVKGARAAWITTEDYPSASIRAGEAGTVGIAVTIGTDGRVAGCSVTASSGHPALDAITCRLYQRRARFTPALDDAGTAVTARYMDRIRWELPAE